MAFNPQRTLSADLFSHKMVYCVLAVSLHNSETTKRHEFLNLGNGPDRKISIFPLWKLDSYTLKSAINAHWLIFLIKNTTLFMYFSFLRQIACLLLLAGNSNSIVSLTQGNSRYGSRPSHSTLPWPLFSWNGTMCHRCVFTQLWDCRKTFFWAIWELCEDCKSSIFLLWKVDTCSLKPARKTHWLFCSPQQKFGQEFEFSDRNRMLAPC